MLRALRERAEQFASQSFADAIAIPYEDISPLQTTFLNWADKQLQNEGVRQLQAKLLHTPVLMDHMADSAVKNRVGKAQIQFHLTNLPVRSFFPLSHFGTYRAATDLLYYTPNTSMDGLRLDGHDEAALYINHGGNVCSNLYPVALDIQNPFDEGVTSSHYIGDTIDRAEKVGVISPAQAQFVRDAAVFGSYPMRLSGDHSTRLAKALLNREYLDAPDLEAFAKVYYKDDETKPLAEGQLPVTQNLKNSLLTHALEALYTDLTYHESMNGLHPDVSELQESARAAKNLWAHYFITIMQQQGFDGIVYENDLEDKGQRCWINFSSEQVRFVNRPDFTPSHDDLDDAQRKIMIQRYLDPAFSGWNSGKNDDHNSLTQGMPIKYVPFAFLMREELREAVVKFLGKERAIEIEAEVGHSIDQYHERYEQFFAEYEAIREKPQLLMEM